VDEDRFFSTAHGHRIRGNGQKLEHRKFHTNTEDELSVRVTEHWNRVTREAVESPSLKIFKTHLDAFLCNLL